MFSDLKTETKITFEKLNQVFSSFKEEQINIIPYEGSWTAGQVGEHIVKSISNLPKFFNHTIEVTTRPADEHCKFIIDLFLDFNSKMNAPEFILPLEKYHDKGKLLESFKLLEQQMLDAIETLDLTMTCKSFEFPGVGYLTRLEWLTFFIVHTKRHTHQLNTIYGVLNNL
jgi:hypothetical protein